MQITPIYLAGQTARMMGLKVDIIKGRSIEHQTSFINGYTSVVPTRPQATGHGSRVLSVNRRT
jgi:hypothetical protein